MPLTSDMTHLTSSGTINADFVAPTSINLATNTFYLDGCTDYQTSAISNSL